MKRVLRTKRSRRRCGYTQRWQSETVNSMVKRNLGSALRAQTANRRKREMLLRAVVHDIMLLRRGSSGCLHFQVPVTSVSFQAVPVLSITFRMIRIFRMHAVMTTLNGLPAACSRWA